MSLVRPLLLAVTIVAGVGSYAGTGTEPRKIGWENLIPDGWIPPAVDIDHFFDAAPPPELSPADVPVVEALNDERVTLPGYIVPLDIDGRKLHSFLLVPYFGACIHVPPPPPNQIVFVQMAQAVSIDDPYGAHWVTGVMSTRQAETELADTSYSMRGESLEVFDFEASYEQASSQ